MQTFNTNTLSRSIHVSEENAKSQRVLVTGASGAIGTPVCQHLLARGHQVRGFSLEANPDLDDQVVGDLSDFDAVRRAVADIDVVIHLGAYPNNADFLDVLLEPNVRGLYHVCAAAVESGVKRLALASSLQVISGHKKEGLIRVEDGAKPTNHYALTKVWAEDIGEMYARVHNLSVINVRVGWFPRNTDEARKLAQYEHGPRVYFSHTDACRFFARCVESATPSAGECSTVFATSLPGEEMRLDLDPALAVLGYEPRDIWPDGIPFPHE
jgi:putative NADH-flavin reductase